MYFVHPGIVLEKCLHLGYKACLRTFFFHFTFSCLHILFITTIINIIIIIIIIIISIIIIIILSSAIIEKERPVLFSLVISTNVRNP